ncbi:MAG TPA: hypothetical protein VJ821_06700 [Anaerolineales bacterium]|nr:hypothetical protein [Anaerolineales bacterium]
MNKLDTKLQSGSFSVSPASHVNITPVHRLIVLVPDRDLDYAAATRRVWALANDSDRDILFIGLYTDISQESSLRRQLVIMTAMIQDGNVEAEARIELGNNWVDVVKSHRQTGEMVVCFAEQRAGLLHRPLSQILQSNLNIPVYIISGLYSKSPSRFIQPSPIAFWAGVSGIIAGSFLLQVRVVSLTQDWIQTTLLMLSITAELCLIWFWNNLFS